MYGVPLMIGVNIFAKPPSEYFIVRKYFLSYGYGTFLERPQHGHCIQNTQQTREHRDSISTLLCLYFFFCGFKQNIVAYVI